MMSGRLAIIPLLLVTLLAQAAEPNKGKGFSMDYGPVLASSIALRGPGKEQTVLAYKSLDIKLGDGAWVSFDTDLLRYAAEWVGDGLDLRKTHMTSQKGDVCVGIAGKVIFSTKVGPGVSHRGSLEDPRNNPMFPQRGPLPKENGQYKGLYLSGDRAVLSYSAGGGEILELPGAVKSGDVTLFTRTMRVERTKEPLIFVLADDAGKSAAALLDGPAGAKVENSDGHLRLMLPAIEKAAVFTVVLGAAAGEAAKSLPPFADPAELMKGGPPRWKDLVETHGELSVSPKAAAEAPYVVDTLPLPEKNPWNAWIRPTGFDFFADGKSAAICTWNGDVWIVSGIDESLSHLTWKRFASGLYEPLGLKIVNDTIYTLGRDQITRLRDLNGDGEADFYENFNNDGLTGDQYHLFKYDLDTDRAGNFYYAVGGNWATTDLFYGHAVLCKVPADGSRLEYFARGFRAPNGMAVGPNGEIAIGDNQGYWMPSSKINYIPPGKSDGFYGFPFEPRIAKTFDAKKFYPNGIPKTFDPPLCWVPYSLDNSSGGQVFVTSDRWGPFKGHILHTSYGKSALFMVMHELVGDVPQGGVWRFGLAFEGGIMRARFNPVDGQLYVCGMRGWQTNSAKDGCLQRVRYTGKAVYEPKELHVTAKGISIEFTCPLDPATANDVGSYDVEQWNYKWSAEYGSPDFSVANPTKKGRDTVDIASAKLQADGRTVFLEMPAIAPVMQMGITYKLKAADGREVEGAVYNTINKVK
jgi:glucose/arabinose dehydrogenase